MTVEVAHGARGMAVSGHRLATEAALDILRQGGNAIDAAICGALVLTVVCPYACSLAGDMYMLIHRPDGDVSGLNATGRAPAAASFDKFPDGMPRSGVRAATVPGFLAGAEDVLQRFGTRSLAELIEPALGLAEGGFAAHPYFIKNIEDRKTLLEQDAQARALFLPGGAPLQPGARFAQHDLARTLRLIQQDGAYCFYNGLLASRIVAASRKLGGLFSEDDLAAHSSLWQKPISAPFYGHTVWTMPPNSYGATLLLQLIALEANRIDRCDPNGIEFIDRGFAARRQAYAAAAKFIADPDLAEEKLKRLLDETIACGHTPATGGNLMAEASGSSTTNIVVIDDKGWSVSLIESISTPFGAGIVLEDTGIVLNNRIAGFNTDPDSLNRIAPYKRPAHTLAPCLVTKDGKLSMTIGTPGTVGQTCTLAQFLARVLACGQNPAEAIRTARWSVDFQGKPIIEDTMAEPLLTQAVAHGAQSMPSGWISFGSIKMAMKADTGFAGYADDRRSASAGGF